MMNLFWTALTVVLAILLIFAITAFVVLVEYLQQKEARHAQDKTTGKR